MRVISTAMVVCSAACHCLALDVQAQEREPARETVEKMHRYAASLKATSRPNGEPLKFIPTPILRYSDPGGITTDATIWLWGDQGRPGFIAGIFFLNQENEKPKWSCELSQLGDSGLEVTSAAGWRWTPESANLKWIKAADVPADSDRQRLRQMKSLAERYEVTAFEQETKSQLRLMIQPLHRYSDPKRAIVDGAVFSFAAGTNPEALLLVECRQEGEMQTWQVAFTRFGANGMEAKLDGAVVWECPAIKRWDRREPYFSHFGSLEQVFSPGAVETK